MRGRTHGVPQLYAAEEETSLQEPHLAGMAVVQVAPEPLALYLWPITALYEATGRHTAPLRVIWGCVL